LKRYIKDREKKPSDYFFYGIFRLFPYSFSKTQKVTAANDLIQYLIGQQGFPEDKHIKRLRHGHLGDIIKKWEKEKGIKIEAIEKLQPTQFQRRHW
jgi:hypothetical protein